MFVVCTLMGYSTWHRHETTFIRKWSFPETQCHSNNWLIVLGQQPWEAQWNLQNSLAALQEHKVTYRFRGSGAIHRSIHNAILLHRPRGRVPADVQVVGRGIVHLDVSRQSSHHWGRKSQRIFLKSVYTCGVFVITSPELTLCKRTKYYPPWTPNYLYKSRFKPSPNPNLPMWANYGLYLYGSKVVANKNKLIIAVILGWP